MATSAISGHSFLQGMEKHLQGRFHELTDRHGCAKSMDLDKLVSEVCSCFSDSCAAISSACGHEVKSLVILFIFLGNVEHCCRTVL